MMKFKAIINALMHTKERKEKKNSETMSEKHRLSSNVTCIIQQSNGSGERSQNNGRRSDGCPTSDSFN